MSRFLGFVLPQIIWMGAVSWLLIFIEARSDLPLTDFFYPILGVFAVASLMNFGIWFNESFRKLLTRTSEATNTARGKRKRNSGQLMLSDLSDEDLSVLRERLRLIDEREDIDSLFVEDGELGARR